MRCLKAQAAEHDLVSRLPHFYFQFEIQRKSMYVKNLFDVHCFLQLVAKRSKYESENDLLRIHRRSQLLF